MAAPVAVTGQLSSFGGRPAGDIKITATPNVTTAITDTGEVVGPAYATSAPDGSYTLTLYRNADLTPANSSYTVNYGRGLLTIVVTGAGTLRSMVVSSAPLPILAIPESQVMGLPEDLTNIGIEFGLKAPLASPTFTGTVTVPISVNSTDAAQKADVTAVNSLVTEIETDLGELAPTTRQVIAGTGLTGGGDLTADRTLTVAYGAAAGTAAAGNDSRFTAVVANIQTANYTLLLTDAGTVVEMNVAGANTLTVPTNASVAFPVGTILEVFQLGAGQCTITAAGGVTFRSDGAKAKTSAQYASVSLRKRGTDEWVLAGDLA